MKKIITIFSLLGAMVFIIFFSYSTYEYYKILHADDPITPYLEVSLGEATIVRGVDLAINMGSGDVYDVREGDIIITRTGSLAILHWGDHSTTRIGEKSRLTLTKMEVADDYSQIETEFSLESGKVWTHVVRTMYPGSFFRVKLPTGGIIAGVRGTTFDINLSLSYIRSIDHSIFLTDGLGRKVSLLPGEAVSARDILEKISKTFTDRFWTELNMVRDATESITRNLRLEKNISSFQLKSTTLWNKFVRYVLSFFPTFDDIDDFSRLASFSPDDLSNISNESLLRWYQYFQDKKFVQERENIRKIFQARIQTTKELTPYLETFARGAVWDSLSFSGMNFPSADTLIKEYGNTLESSVKRVIEQLPTKDIELKARETLRSLMN